MKLNITIELTQEEMRAIITEHLQDKEGYKYGSPLKNGCVLEVSEFGPRGFLVEWGEKS